LTERRGQFLIVDVDRHFLDEVPLHIRARLQSPLENTLRFASGPDARLHINFMPVEGKNKFIGWCFSMKEQL
jgi:hypothetical protein